MKGRRKSYIERILATTLILVLLCVTMLRYTSITLQAADENVPKVTNLKLNLLEEPYGVPKDDLAFSWAMEDADAEEKQTAYRIVIAKTKNNASAGTGDVFDSGWVESSQSAGVVPSGLSLSDNSLYYWSVQIKDKDGNISEPSEPQVFSTAVDSGWETINGIWDNTAARSSADINLFQEKGWTNYAIEMDIKTGSALGIAFRGQNNGNDSYFWQFRGDNNTVVPHYVANGEPAAYANATLNVPDTAKAINGDDFTRIKLQIIGNQVTAYVEAAPGIEAEDATQDEIENVTPEDAVVEGQADITEVEFVQIGESFDLDMGLEYGSIGLRTGSTESGYIDNINVYQIDKYGAAIENGTLFSTDFSNGNMFYVGSVSEGVLTVPKDISIPSLLSVSMVYPEEGANTLEATGDFIFARDSFTLDSSKTLEKAIVSVTAKSPEAIRQYVYNLYVNGQFVGLGPARFDTDPADNSGIFYYNTYDVTDKLNQGVDSENVIGAICYTSSEKSFLCQLTAFYTDGTSEVITNSGVNTYGWKTKDGTNAFGDNSVSIGTSYYSADSQNLNAYAWPDGWDEPGYTEDADWISPASQGAIVNTFDFSPYPADRVMRYDVKPVSVTDKGNGTYLIDMGQEIVGGFGLSNITSERPAMIQIHYGEELENGSVKYQMRTGNTYLEHWTLKAGTQSLENTGMMTFRYVEILNCPVELTTENVKGVAIRQEFSDGESAFSSSDELLNKIYNVTKYSIKATNQDIMVDSQSRERLAYEGDLLINALSSYSFEDDYALARFSNEWLATHRGWPAEYVLYTVINAWNDYLYTGDKRSLEEYYNVLGSDSYERRALYSGNLNDENQLLRYSTDGQNVKDAILVDWPVGETDGYIRTEYNTVFNAVAYGAYNDMAKIAEALGKTEDQTKWQNLADTIKAGMIANLYDASKGAFRDGIESDHYSQHATAFALAYGIYKDQAMANKLAAYIRSQGEIRTSVYGAFFLLQGLYNAGAGDIAMNLMTSSGTRSWNHMINDLGATITAEAWDPANKDNMTFSHPWGSAPASQIVRGMFGIQPTSAGFESFQVKFQPGDVANAEIKVPTVKGSIEAEYTVANDNSITATVVIPANTSAEVYVPILKTSKNAALLVNGEEVEAELTENGKFQKVILGSGTYTLTQELVHGRIAYFSFDDGVDGLKGDGAVATGLTEHGVILSEDGYSNRALDLSMPDCPLGLSVTSEDGSSLLTGLEEVTISYYSKPTVADNPNWGYFAAPNGDSPGTNGIYAYLGSFERNGTLKAERFAEGWSSNVASTAIATDSVWKHIVVVYGVDSTKIYVDGWLKSEHISEYSLTEILGNNSIFQIGKSNHGSGEYYRGYIDEFSIYDYAMDADEVLELHGGIGKWVVQFDFDDETGGFSDLHAVATQNGGPTREAHDNGYALKLDGIDDYLDVKASDGSSLLTGVEEMTIAYYSKPEPINRTNWGFYAAPNSSKVEEGQRQYVAGFETETYTASHQFNRSNKVDGMMLEPSNSGPSGNWRHIAVVYGKNNTKLYVNGELIGDITKENTLIKDILGTNSIFQIGKANWHAGEYYQGLIDDFTIANYAMSEEEIRAMSTRPDQWVVQFDFDDTESGFRDLYARANAKGDVSLQPHEDGNALYLNGKDAYLSVVAPDGGSLLTGAKALTISFDMKLEGQDKTGDWMFFAAPDTNVQEYRSEHYLGISDGQIEQGGVRVERYNSTNQDRPNSATVDNNSYNWYEKWNHVTVVYTETDMKLYVNGELKGDPVSSDVAIDEMLKSNSILYIGKANWEAGEYYQGLLDNYTIANYAMSEEEIKELSGVANTDAAPDIDTDKWVAQFTFDNEANGFTSDYAVANRMGTPELRAHGDGNAVYFDGATEYLEITDPDGKSLLTGVEELTVSFQMKPEFTGSANWMFYAAPDGRTQVYPNEVYLGAFASNRVINAERYNNNGGRPPVANATTDANSWLYVTIVYGKDDTIIYFNGEEVARQTSDYPLTEILGENSIFYVAKALWGTGEYYKGLLDNYTIANYAMTPEEIRELTMSEYIYFDNALSRMDSMQYSIDGGKTWYHMELVAPEDAPIGENVCTESLWRVKIPSGADTITFHGFYGGKKNETVYPSVCYTTETYEINELNLDEQNCFYGSPIVWELSVDADNNTTGNKPEHNLIGGSWKNVNAINDIGNSSNMIASGTFIPDKDIYYATSTFYDYYSDYELWGKMLTSSEQVEKEDEFSDQPIYAWNLAISDYYEAEALREIAKVYPLYFGGHRMLGSGYTSTDLISKINNLSASATYGNGTNGLAKEDKHYLNDGTLQYFPSQGLLNKNNVFTNDPEVEVDGNFKNLYLQNSELATPYFNEEFLLGDNVYKTQLGAVYKDVSFPFVKSKTGYWTFDSSEEEYSVRLTQQENGTYFLNRTGASGAVTYAGTPFFFPFNAAGNYVENSPAEGEKLVSNLDYMFGSVIDISFALTKDRKIYNETGDVGKNTVFTFSGDDDVWVFLEGPDGKQHLVLDIGGSHGAVSGAIDFTTGMVAISGKWDPYTGADTDAYACDKDEFIKDAEENGITEEFIAERTVTTTSTAEDGTETTTTTEYLWHSTLEALGIDVTEYEAFKEYKLKIYYMERGLDQSNLRITFNFAYEKQVAVEKEWSDGMHSKDFVPVSLYQVIDGDKQNAKLTPDDDISTVSGKTMTEDKSNAQVDLSGSNNWKCAWLGLKSHIHDASDVQTMYSYYVAEDNVPTGYEVHYYDELTDKELLPVELTVDGKTVYAIPAEETHASIVIKNQRLADLIINKAGIDLYEDPELLSGVPFTLYKATVDVNGNWNKVPDTKYPIKGVTDSDGKLEFVGLVQGTYLLYEDEEGTLGPSYGYFIPSEPWHVTVDGRGTIEIAPASQPDQPIEVKGSVNDDNHVTNETTINNREKITLNIIKADAEDPSIMLEGAMFKLEKLTSMGLVDENFQTIEIPTNSDGYAIFTGLDDGIYRLTETKAAAGYNLLQSALTIVIDRHSEKPVTVDSRALDDTYVVENTINLTVLNRKMFEFPATGGVGVYNLILCGFALAAVGTTIYRLQISKKGGRGSRKRE